ncbi:MAG: glycogen synthase GlgA [Candidatus Omnitrophota bacterium]
MTIAFCSSEIFPFSKTGGLADVSGSLPAALRENGEGVVLFQPKYRDVDEKRFGLIKVASGLYKANFHKSIDVYFIDRPSYYDREGLYGDAKGDYPDNFERFDFFCRRILEVIKEQNLQIDVVHCHDWQTGLIPVYLKFLYHADPFYHRIKTVFTIHNLAYQGLFAKEYFGRFEFSGDDVLQKSGLYFYGKLSLLRGGIVNGDRVTTVSPQYAKEIQTEAYGCGMQDVLSARRDGVIGILNGLDYSIWDPEHDGLISRRYSGQFPDGKADNKKEVQLGFGLPARPDAPLFGFVGRLSHQKGVDLIVESASRLLENDIQIVFLGVGDAESQNKIAAVADRYPNKVAAQFAFDERVAHQIYAGCDFFLMPSIYEPCGLSQMISLAYGTIPIVFKTGGLADTVVDAGAGGNGLVFDVYDSAHFSDAVLRAINLYGDFSKFDEVMTAAFKSKFSWQDSAKAYQQLYKDVVRQ